MDGKVVQLVQGRDKALEGGTVDEMLERFRDFPEIQVIDLDAALSRGENSDLVRYLAAKARIRAGGGVRTVDRAHRLLEEGAFKVIVGTAAFAPGGINRTFLEALAGEIGPEKVLIALDSKDGRVVIKGWREFTRFTAEELIRDLEPYCGGFLCTYVDTEGMMLGTDLEWFARLRKATSHELTAAGGITTMEEIKALDGMRVHAALGMAIYTGKLRLEELSAFHGEA